MAEISPRISDVKKVYKIAKSENPWYLIDLWCPGHGFGVQVDMPEQLTIAVSSDWENRLPSSVSQALEGVDLGGLIRKGMNIAGWDAIAQAASFQMWVGTSPIEIPLTVLFDAEKSGLDDVYEPIVQLQSLVLPRNDTSKGVGFLTPPGPNVGLGWGGDSGYGMHIKIGRMMLFLNCILVSANAVFDARLDEHGFPISGQIDMVIRTHLVYGRDDWLVSMGIRNP